MGYAERENLAKRTRLERFRAVVDVQHLYKLDRPDDRGARFELANGTHLWEADAAMLYAQAMVSWFKERGAVVLTNDPSTGTLVGSYGRRNRAANAWGASVYLACHLNAGGGNYALAEYPAGYPGSTLARMITAQLTSDFHDLIPSTNQFPLAKGQRGHVCVGEVSSAIGAVLLEPFFGDHPKAQALLAPDRLIAVGQSIAAGVAKWWELP
jgi:N-acetylmuramoyl-L-alanine amidase